MKRFWFWVVGLVALWFTGIGFLASAAGLGNAAILHRDTVPTATKAKWRGTPALVVSRETVLLAWCEGSGPRASDTAIWMARWEDGQWKLMGQVATGYNPKTDVRLPCFDPVLFEDFDGTLWLFYQVGRNPLEQRGCVRMSLDGGKTWTRYRMLPRKIYGPTHNRPLQLGDGTILCPVDSREAGWRVHLEWTKHPIREMWIRGGAINSAFVLPCTGPALIEHDDGRFQIFAGTRTGRMATAWSKQNSFRRWESPERILLPNPGTPVAAIRLLDGRILLAYNHSADAPTVLNLALSPDGQSWRAACEVDRVVQGRLEEPDVVQTPDLKIHLVYGRNGRSIEHVILDPKKLAEKPISQGRWP